METPNRFRIEVHLAASSRDSGGELRFLTARRGDAVWLPHEELASGGHTRTAAYLALFKLTGVDARPWVNVRQSGFVNTGEDWGIVLYSLCVPEPIPVTRAGASWMSFDQIAAEKQDVGPGLTTLGLIATANQLTSVWNEYTQA